MAATDTAVRVVRYLERCIAWFEGMLSDLDELERTLNESDWDRWAAMQDQRTSAMEVLTREHRGLLRDWQAHSDYTPEQREKVRQLAAHAELLRDLVLARHAELQRTIGQRMQTEVRNLSALRKGRDLLERYRPTGGQVHDFLDRKA